MKKRFDPYKIDKNTYRRRRVITTSDKIGLGLCMATIAYIALRVALS